MSGEAHYDPPLPGDKILTEILRERVILLKQKKNVARERAEAELNERQEKRQEEIRKGGD